MMRDEATPIFDALVRALLFHPEWMMWTDHPFQSVSYSEYSPSDIGRPSNEPENK